MNYDLDDPLGDLLGDGSDDSFFESGPTKKDTKNETSKTGIAGPLNQSSKAKLENLFGVSNKEVVKPQQIPSSSGPSSLVAPTVKKPETLPKVLQQETRPKTTFAKKEIKFDDDDSSSLDLGFDPKKPKGGKKSSILDELLGIDEPKKTDNITIAPKTPTTRLHTSALNSSRLTKQQSIEKERDDQQQPSSVNTNYNLSSGRPRPLMKRESSTSFNDPLGIFPSSSETPQTKEPKPAPSKKPLTIDWLGLKDSSTEEHKSLEPLPQKSQPEPMQQPQPTPVLSNISALPQQSSNVFEISRPSISQTAQMISVTNIETENALSSLKQQETQLMIAAQMKNQEIALIDMQQRQKELLQQQEFHFNDLLQKQLQRQSALEIDIKRQQEHINSHIQILMAQPIRAYDPIGRGNEFAGGSKVNSSRGADAEEQDVSLEDKRITEVELRADIKSLELEKLRLEDLVQKMKTNHEQEVDFLEQSHSKQVTFLEDGIGKLEQRLKNENESLNEYYLKKVELSDEVKRQLIENYEDKLKKTEDNYANIIAKLKTKYEEDLVNVKEEHKNMIETIRQSKLLEFSLVQENSSYLQTLKNAANYLETASDNFQNVKEDLNQKIESIHREKEIELEAKEKLLQTQLDQIARTKDATEIERSRLLELVKSLETKLNSLTQTTAEEQWNLRQQQASLEAERNSFERERTYAREQQTRDEKRIEDLKFRQLEEYSRLMDKINEERETVRLEKSKLEMMNKLQKPNDAAISRTEVDSAVKVAQDAARQCDVERERFIEMQRQFETKRRELIDRESLIRSKQLELEAAMETAISKERNAEYAGKNAKIMEQQFHNRLQILQQNFRDLTMREQRLSEQKLDLSRERLEIQALRRKVYQSRCSLCKIGERSQELNDALSRQDHYQDYVQTGAGTRPTIVDDIPNLDVDRMMPDWDFKKYEKSLDIEVAESLKKLNEVRNLEIFDLENVSLNPGGIGNMDNSLDSESVLAKLNIDRDTLY